MSRVQELPRIFFLGDIIMLSRVVMKIHSGAVTAVFNKKFSSFALFEGKNGKDFLTYQHSSKYHPRDQDLKFIEALRKWLPDLHLNEGSDSFKFFREIKEGERANLLCKVFHVGEVSKQVWMAYVWDGTDCPPAHVDTKLENELDCPLPLQMEPLPLPRDLLSTFPTVGTILRVIVDKGNDGHVLHLFHIGKWVKFLNIRCEVHAGLWRGVLTPFTKLHYMSDDNPLVLGCQRSYNERLSLGMGHIPYWCFPRCSTLTDVDYNHIPFVTLMDALTCSQVTAKFRCVVRVVAAFPWQVEHFHSRLGTYGIRLTLEEPTARIHAFLYGEDGEFFDGYPSTDILIRKRNTLLGVTANEGAARDPPWIQCCLKSYYHDRNDLWGSRHFRIFGTKHVN